MATWAVETNDAGVRYMVYRNTVTRREQYLDKIYPHITDANIIDWVIDQDANVGDTILLPTGPCPIWSPAEA